MKIFSGVKGFTMIELLTVIVTIGVLSVTAMAAYTQVASSAQATQILNDMKIIKTAVTAWYVDNHMDRVTREEIQRDYIGTYKVHTLNSFEEPQFIGVYSHSDEGGEELLSYVSNAKSIKLASPFQSEPDRAGHYYLRSENNGRWYVSYTFGENDGQVKKKLAKNEDAHELIGKINIYYLDSTKITKEEKFDPEKDNVVSMLILNFE